MSRSVNAAEAAQMSNSLGRIDKIAQHIQNNFQKWGMSFEDAKTIVQDLDRTADEVETFVFGPESFERRQQEVITDVITKEAKVLQRDNDENYMGGFETDMGVVQQDADEGYMSAYKDDQSSAVGTGADASGRKLAPGY